MDSPHSSHLLGFQQVFTEILAIKIGLMESDSENHITITVSGTPDLGKLALIYQIKSYLKDFHFDVETQYEEGLNFEMAGGRRVIETLQGISMNTKIKIIEEPKNG